MFKVSLSEQVAKFINTFDPKLREKCIASFRMLEENPFIKRAKCDIKKLSGKHGVYRLRVGKYRFTYKVEGRIIIIAEAFHRQKGY